MKQIETIATGKNFSAVSVGKVNEIIEHELPMGAVTIQGKVFEGKNNEKVFCNRTRSSRYDELQW